jgi:hypothetical protein
MKKKAGRNRRQRRLHPGNVDAVVREASPVAEEQPAQPAKAQPVTRSGIEQVPFESGLDDQVEEVEGSSEGPVTVVRVIVALVLAFIIIITWLISLGYGPATR